MYVMGMGSRVERPYVGLLHDVHNVQRACAPTGPRPTPVDGCSLPWKNHSPGLKAQPPRCPLHCLAPSRPIQTAQVSIALPCIITPHPKAPCCGGAQPTQPHTGRPARFSGNQPTNHFTTANPTQPNQPTPQAALPAAALEGKEGRGALARSAGLMAGSVAAFALPFAGLLAAGRGIEWLQVRGGPARPGLTHARARGQQQLLPVTFLVALCSCCLAGAADGCWWRRGRPSPPRIAWRW